MVHEISVPGGRGPATSTHPSGPTARLPAPGVRLAGRSVSAFLLCGCAGLGAAVLVAVVVTIRSGLSLAVLSAMVVVGVLTFLTLALATKIIVGEERLIYYHHEIAIMAVTALVVRALGRPVAPYLDVAILAIGAFLACGRVGCLLAGCCHGRPHRWGVCYGPAHAAEGFAAELVGVRLFPIQAVEAVTVLAVVAIGVALVFRGQAPGSALAWYTLVYGWARFGFEFARGDAARAHRLGFSEAQWTTLVLLAALTVAERTGALGRPSVWPMAATVAMAATMCLVALRRRDAAEPLRPEHVLEIAAALDWLGRAGERTSEGADGPMIHVVTTSFGLRISGGSVRETGRSIAHYTVSSARSRLGRRSAWRLAKLIGLLRHPTARREFSSSASGSHHIIFRAESSRPSLDANAAASKPSRTVSTEGGT